MHDPATSVAAEKSNATSKKEAVPTAKKQVPNAYIQGQGEPRGSQSILRRGMIERRSFLSD